MKKTPIICMGRKKHIDESQLYYLANQGKLEELEKTLIWNGFPKRKGLIYCKMQ